MTVIGDHQGSHLYMYAYNNGQVFSHETTKYRELNFKQDFSQRHDTITIHDTHQSDGYNCTWYSIYSSLSPAAGIQPWSTEAIMHDLITQPILCAFGI